MSFLLRFIPEPWGTVAIAAAVIGAYFYGNTTGNVKGRYEEQLKTLRQQNQYLTEDLKNASRVQTAISREVVEARNDVDLLKVRGAELAKALEAKSNGVCNLSNAERMRIRSTITIGR